MKKNLLAKSLAFVMLTALLVGEVGTARVLVNAETVLEETVAGVDEMSEDAVNAVRLFWDTPLRTGVRRYYDNCLQLFAWMALSGNYRIYR